jgi:hydrogenase maturation protein HypF
MNSQQIARRILVYGLVQGIGFRPYIARLAEELNISGSVKNCGGIVEIEACASAKAMDEFLHRLHASEPAGAQIMKICTEPFSKDLFSERNGFFIAPSDPSDLSLPLFPPDLPMCGQCRSELHDPQNRRYHYPFISCVACGPRYSITRELPYDRCNMTMNVYSMCPDCHAEYTGQTRRRHAQTISCHDCGPELILDISGAHFYGDEALKESIRMLKAGEILAVKNTGGYHFVCLPGLAPAVEGLRQLKGREKKPFAVMFHQAEDIQSYCKVTPKDLELLISLPRPIVLMEKHLNVAEILCPSVCGDSRFLGAFLPSTPLQDLLTAACGPLIMTSGNQSGSSIIIRDEEMLSLESPYLAGVLYNTREILTPLDDSIVQLAAGRPQVIRRSRGFIPSPVALPLQTEKDCVILAAGGDLKASFCFAAGNKAYPGQYFGDLEDYSVYRSYLQGMRHMKRLLGIEPSAIACDLHPGYLSSRHARKAASEGKLPLFPIQHHHAHIASVIAEHHLQGKVLGIAFDGTGYGDDGTLWGGEFLLCEGAGYARVAHLHRTMLCGGDASARDADLSAMGFLLDAGLDDSSDPRFPIVASAIRQGINTERSSSMGRLFDAVSALLDFRHSNDFEAECAIALENAAARAMAANKQPFKLEFGLEPVQAATAADAFLEIDTRSVIRQIHEAKKKGTDPEVLALGFHEAVARMVLAVSNRVRQGLSYDAIALSGGVFANQILLQRCFDLLEGAGHTVYINQQVPANDGGIALGQAYISTHLIKGCDEHVRSSTWKNC